MAEGVGRGSDKFMLRLPDGMRNRIAEEARRNGRSMNAEITARLESSLKLPVGEEKLSRAAIAMITAGATAHVFREFHRIYSNASEEERNDIFNIIMLATDVNDAYSHILDELHGDGDQYQSYLESEDELIAKVDPVEVRRNPDRKKQT